MAFAGGGVVFFCFDQDRSTSAEVEQVQKVIKEFDPSVYAHAAWDAGSLMVSLISCCQE